MKYLVKCLSAHNGSGRARHDTYTKEFEARDLKHLFHLMRTKYRGHSHIIEIQETGGDDVNE